LSLLLIGILSFLGYFSGIIGFFSFFEKRNFVYLEYLTKFPFGKGIGIILMFIGLIIPFAFKNNKIKDKSVFAILILFLSLIFFIFIADRYSNFVYISHITVISITFMISVFMIIKKCYSNKFFKIILWVILLSGIVYSIVPEYTELYTNEDSYGKFSQAYPTIINNYTSDEVVFGQYLRSYYIKDLGKDANIISMRNNRNYSYDEFINDLDKYDSGWITWETRKSYHINGKIRGYISKNFKHLHGTGVDNTMVEVYYFDDDMKN
jgi:hypothetical protein